LPERLKFALEPLGSGGAQRVLHHSAQGFALSARDFLGVARDVGRKRNSLLYGTGRHERRLSLNYEKIPPAAQAMVQEAVFLRHLPDWSFRVSESQMNR
jgi:hypothetical protein